MGWRERERGRRSLGDRASRASERARLSAWREIDPHHHLTKLKTSRGTTHISIDYLLGAANLYSSPLPEAQWSTPTSSGTRHRHRLQPTRLLFSAFLSLTQSLSVCPSFQTFNLPSLIQSVSAPLSPSLHRLSSEQLTSPHPAQSHNPRPNPYDRFSNSSVVVLRGGRN